MNLEIIRDLVNSENFNLVQMKYGLYKYELNEILDERLCSNAANLNIEEQEIIKKIYMENASMMDITDEKVMFISDTHMGRTYQRDDYFQFVLDYCKYNGIHSLIHAGDISDGRCTENGEPKWFENDIEARKNAEIVLNDYPTTSDLTQYVISGNHDEWYDEVNVQFFKELDKKQNVVLIGNRTAFFTICGYPILLKHDMVPWHTLVTNNDISNLIPYSLTISGHSHISRFNRSVIYLPTLSRNIIHTNEEDGLPGCVIMQVLKEGNIIKLQFDRIYFTMDDNVEKGPSHIYTLKK